ncbi:MAG: hypothetical protein ACXAC7_08800 [Candidatus Hodarchaeales archaeon]|jgi:hypothetical protein
MKIDVRDRALRNLLILAIIPFVMLIWLSFLWFLYEFQDNIYDYYVESDPFSWWLLFIVFLSFK